MQTVIETRDLCKFYGQQKAVDHLSLHVPQASVYGFIGPNGAGKSTTMKMLLGLIHPTARAGISAGQGTYPIQPPAAAAENRQPDWNPLPVIFTSQLKKT